MNLTPEQAELITEPIEFDWDLNRTYRKNRIDQALRLLGEVFGSSFENAGESVCGRCDDNQGQAFKDGLAMLGYEYGDHGATHFANASDGHGVWTSYHIKTLGRQFTANADFYFASSLTQNWAEALQIIEDKDWGIRGVDSDEYYARVCHDDKSRWNPRGCNRCTSGCRYCAKGIWSKTEPC